MFLNWINQNKKHVIILSILLVIGISTVHIFTQIEEENIEKHKVELQQLEEKRKAELQRFEEEAWSAYNNGLSALQEKYVDHNDAKNAISAFSIFSPNNRGNLTERGEPDKILILENEKYKDIHMLLHYAEAIVNYNDLRLDKQIACNLALSELDKIPDSYNGVLADDINNYRNYVSTEKKENQMLRDALDEADRHEQATKVHIGDPDIKVTQIFGEPQQKNKTVTQNGTREQWVYGNGTYIYLQDGAVTSWQMRE